MNIKGKSKIELFENGILVDRSVDHNLVTTFLNDMINLFFMKPTKGFTGSTYEWPTTTYLTMLLALVDGVVLFEDPLTLNAAKYRIPTANPVVAYAAGIAYNDDPKAGTFNIAESVFDDVGKTQKLVFDFATDRGNGTFEALGIAPGRGTRSLDYTDTAKVNNVGAHSMDFDYTTYYDATTKLEMDIAVGLINNIIYGTIVDTLLTGTIVIKRSNTYFADFSPFNPFNHKKYVAINEQLSDLEYIVPAGRCADFKILNNKFYSIEHNQSAPYDINIKELNPIDMSVLSTVNISVPANMYYSWLYSYAQIADDILYIMQGNDKTEIFKFNITTGASLGSITPPAPFTAFDKMFHADEDGSLLMVGTNLANIYMMLDSDGLSTPFVNYVSFYSSRNTSIPKGPTISYMYQGTPRITLMTLGLISQNNLAAPVTKTSAQTMKITYTLSW